MALLDRISPDQLPSSSHSMKAAAYYIHGLQSFFSSQYGESKRYLRETLKMANAEDLNRLTSCSLVLLGHIFLTAAGRTGHRSTCTGTASSTAGPSKAERTSRILFLSLYYLSEFYYL